MGTCFIIYNYISPGTAVKTAALVAGGASNVLNRTNTLFRQGYREVQDQDTEVRDLPDSEDQKLGIFDSQMNSKENSEDQKLGIFDSQMNSKEKISFAKDGPK